MASCRQEGRAGWPLSPQKDHLDLLERITVAYGLQNAQGPWCIITVGVALRAFSPSISRGSQSAHQCQALGKAS